MLGFTHDLFNLQRQLRVMLSHRIATQIGKMGPERRELGNCVDLSLLKIPKAKKSWSFSAFRVLSKDK